MYAIIGSGGKQEKVSKGDIVELEKIDAEEGKKIKLTEVLLVNTGKEQEIVSFELSLGKQFSLERTGFKNYSTKRIPEFGAGVSAR